MKVKISYYSDREDKNAEALILMMAYAVQGKPVSTKFVQNGKGKLRELIFNIPGGTEPESAPGVFCETACDILDDFGYQPTFGIP